MRPLDPRLLHSPRSVAIIGASSNPAGHAGRALSNLLRLEFPGEVHPVNPKYDELQGRRCYPDVTAIPEPPEVAYVLLPAVAAVQAVEECGKAGVVLAVVCSSGFSELGEDGDRLQAELREISERHGIRVVGPNCIGIISPSGSFVGAPTFNITYDQRPGSLAILSHSGGMAVTVFNRAQAAGVGVHTVVSLGNEADVTMADCLAALADDDDVQTIGLVVEQIRDPHGFQEAARAAARAGKRIVALKNGRSEQGAAAVSGHTGALAGSAGVFSAVAKECGILEASSVDQLTDTLMLLDRTEAGTVGSRIGVVSPSGGETVYVADQARGHGVVLPELAPELSARIQEWMPLGNPANPLDLTGSIIGDASLLTKVLDAVGTQDDIDLLLVALATWGPYDADAILSRVLDSARAAGAPVVFSAWDAGRMTEQVTDLLAASGMPWFPSPDRALAAIALASQERVVRPPVEQVPGHEVTPPAGADGVLGEYDAARLLSAAGVPMARQALVADTAEAVEIARQWEVPVVLKAHAPDVVHKSDLGLVEVGLRDPDEVAAAADRIVERAERAGVAVHGLLVSTMERGAEVIVGGVDDPAFGRFVLVGAGGVLAEHFRDTVLVPAPADADRVRSALASLSSWPVLAGVRGEDNDTEALVQLVVDFSQVFAANEWMHEVDLNPVLVRPRQPGGAVAVDAVVHLAVAEA